MSLSLESLTISHGSSAAGTDAKPNHSGRAKIHDRTRRTLLGTIETFDHTADVGLRIIADDLDDLFRTAAEGVFDYIVANRDQVREVEEESVSLSADDPATLLVDWLNELIFRCETRHRLYSRFDVGLR